METAAELEAKFAVKAKFKRWCRNYLKRVKTFGDLERYRAKRDKWEVCFNRFENEAMKCVYEDGPLKECKDRLMRTCSVCGKCFETVSLCTRHVFSHADGMYRCHCGRAYNYAGNLSRHKKKCF